MQQILYLKAQLERPDLHELSTGSVAAFSAPAPDGDRPNQDAAVMISCEPESVVLAVADGVGGLQAGDEASRIAVRSIAAAVQNAVDSSDGPQSFRDAILDGIEQANNKIIAMARGAATTVVVAEIQRNQLRSYYVGDSMILLTGQRGRLKFQNISHSPVGYALESGLIDEQEAISHDERNLVSNVLGSAEMSIEIGPVLEMAPRDTLLLCSDSLPDNLYIEEIIELVRRGPLDRVAKRLVASVRQRMCQPAPGEPSHSDDTTFVLYRPDRAHK